MSRQPLRAVVVEAEQLLAKAGVDSPRVDAELLAAHVLGIERTRLPLVTEMDPTSVGRYQRLIARRGAREPLQHITGWAPIGAIMLSVGPGVFVPRPETDLMLDWALTRLRELSQPVVVDLCTGSGALALGFANIRPDAVVHAVEREPSALSWARRNADARARAGDTPITLHTADATDPELLTELNGEVDLVLCNPPYVPHGTPVPPEVARHDPPVAVFGGTDGLDVIRHVITQATRLLRPGGLLAVEHDDSHAPSVLELLDARRVLADVADHPDLAGRPRFATARRVIG